MSPRTITCQASLSFRICWSFSNSCPLIWWYRPTISFSAAHFSSCLQSFPAATTFSMSQLFTSGGQSIGASASASVFPMNIKDWFPLGLTGWLPCSPRDSQESFPAPQFEGVNSSALSLLYGPTLTSVYNYWETKALTIWTFVSKVMSLALCFNKTLFLRALEPDRPGFESQVGHWPLVTWHVISPPWYFLVCKMEMFKHSSELL